MRRDKHLLPTLNLTEPQNFFMNCWFNMVHQASVDSYRVRIMNPENILREFLKMYESQADENDRRRVAQEANVILNGDPILLQDRYKIVKEFCELINLALRSKGDEDSAISQDKSKAQGFIKNATLIKSFSNELLSTLKTYFFTDCINWIEASLTQDTAQLSDTTRDKLYVDIERVCGNLISILLDDGVSFESLYQHYRGLVKSPVTSSVSEDQSDADNLANHIAESYSFNDRFLEMKTRLTAPLGDHKLFFVLNNVNKPEQFPPVIGNLNFSATPPDPLPKNSVPANRFLRQSSSRIFVSATIQGRDGRASGMIAYRQIGQVLDLVRFEFDKTSVELRPHFLLEKDNRHVLLRIPQIIPNPETELPPQNLEEFVKHLNGLVQRETMHSESKDRIFSAFRLYRVGADAEIFENKLVNWWTALEYLAQGGKSGGGSIGGSVESALAPTLSLAYLPKHLSVYRAMFREINGTITMPNGDILDIGSLTNENLYKLLKDTSNKPALQNLCANNPYLWHHLRHFIDAISTPTGLQTLLKAHDQRLRWQIQRIYRARCDIVHSGQQVVNASLLCANLEYYLQVTLNSMLRSFQTVATLQGPHEFFERTRHKYERIMQELSSKTPNDTLLIQSLS